MNKKKMINFLIVGLTILLVAIAPNINQVNAYENNLEAYYNFETIEQGEVLDQTEYNHDGISHGVTLSTTERYGMHSLDFDGSNDYVNLGNVQAFKTQEGTVATWIRIDEGGGGVIFAGSYQYSKYYYMMLMANGVVGDSDYLTFYSSNGGSLGIRSYVTGINIDDGDWHHIAFTSDGSSTKVYVDGTYKAFTDHDFPTHPDGYWWNDYLINDFNIGMMNQGGTPYGYFEGLMDDLRVYTTSKTQAEIFEIASGTDLAKIDLPLTQGTASGSTVYDVSGNGYHGVQTGTSWGVDGLYFYGNDYVKVDNINSDPNPITDPTGYDVTWSFSFKMDDSAYQYCYIVSTGAQTSSTGFAAVVSHYTGKMWVGFKTQNSYVNTNGYEIEISRDVWHTVVATFTGSQAPAQQRMHVILDGRVISSYAAVGGVNYTNAYDDLTIGCPNNAVGSWGYSWYGYIKDVRVENGIFHSSVPLDLRPDWARTFDHAVVAKAQELIAGKTTDYAKAEAIHSQVNTTWHHNIDYWNIPPTIGTYFEKDSTILNDLFYDSGYNGLCWHASVFASSLCRAVEIPSRIIHIVTEDTELIGNNLIGSFHWTTEFWNGNDWIPMDVDSEYGWFGKNSDSEAALKESFVDGGNSEIKSIYIVNAIHSSGSPTFSYETTLTMVDMSTYDNDQYEWYMNAVAAS